MKLFLNFLLDFLIWGYLGKWKLGVLNQKIKQSKYNYHKSTFLTEKVYLENAILSLKITLTHFLLKKPISQRILQFHAICNHSTFINS